MRASSWLRAWSYDALFAQIPRFNSYTRIEGEPTVVLLRGKSHAPPLCLVVFEDFEEAKQEAAKLADMVGFQEFKATAFYTSYKPEQEL